MIIFSGDLVDDDYKLTHHDINFLIGELSKLDAKYGIYAVLGDQDIKNLDEVSNIYLQSNFKVLNNESVVVQNEDNEKILVTGFSTYIKTKYDIDKELGNIDDSVYKIAVLHEPDYVDTILKSKVKYSLILSSHSINGSFNIPIIKRLFLPLGAKHYYNEYYKIGDTKLYVSNGIGVDRINFRLFNSPSINFYRLRRK